MGGVLTVREYVTCLSGHAVVGNSTYTNVSPVIYSAKNVVLCKEVRID